MSNGGQAPPPPVAPPDGSVMFRDTAWFQYVRLVVLLLVIALAVVTGMSMVIARSDPTVDQLKEQAGLTGKAELRIGVGSDRPGLSWLQGGMYEGFEIDIAYMIAARLDFTPDQVRFLWVPTEERRRMQGYEGDELKPVDMVIASYSITPEREALPGVMFSAPYLETQISVVTRRPHDEVQSLGDLAGEKVCTLEAGTAVKWAEDSGIEPRDLAKARTISKCMDELRKGKTEAVVSDAAILAGWVHRYRRVLMHHNIATDEEQRYGINVGQNEALRKLVNLALYCSRYDPADQSWESAFREHLAPLQATSPEQQVAKPVQPNATEPKVRRLLWEYWVSDSAADRRRARCD